MLLLLKVKTAHVDKLPWLFCALAHTDEGIARSYGKLIKDAWSQDPRREAHHRITWSLMKPGSAFSQALDAFVAGAARSSLPVEFRMRIASFRFVAFVETTIEAKHARTSLARKAHHLGPVRISLANRLPFLERSIRTGHIEVEQLIQKFQQARHLADVPGCGVVVCPCRGTFLVGLSLTFRRPSAHTILKDNVFQAWSGFEVARRRGGGLGQIPYYVSSAAWGPASIVEPTSDRHPETHKFSLLLVAR
jgi:hypothetical protein